MRILNRYVLKNTAVGYLFILLIFIGLYFVIDIFSSLSDMIKSQTPPHTLIAYYFFMLPLIFLRVGPFSLLISALYSFGEMNKANEITSMRACGISMPVICLPVICFALFLSVASFFIQEKFLMDSQKKVAQISARFIKKDSKDNALENFAFPYGNSIFFAQRFMPKDGCMENVTIFEENEKGDIARKIICKRLIYQPSNWKARDIVEYTIDPMGNIFGKPKERVEGNINLSGLPQEIVSLRTIFNQYSSLKTIKKERKRLRRVGESSLYAAKTIDYHNKISDPFTNFFLIFAAIPFAAEIKKRRVALSALSSGFIFGFGYYWLGAICTALAKNGTLLPMMGPWTAPAFFFAMGLTGFILLR